MRKKYLYDYYYYKTSADYVRERINDEPEIAIILGTSLGNLADMIEDPIEIPYEDIPNFLLSTVENHAGKLIFGSVAGRKIICMSGRFHYYEGYDYEQLVIPIRLFKLLGAKLTILTNACGAVNESYRLGDVMIINDHIQLIGASPLRGPNVEAFGPRFFDTTQMYNPFLRQIAYQCGQSSPINFHEGIYMFFTGPQFETPAEIRVAKLLGADVVGMSTVTEALTAAHCGMPLLAFSVITNMASGVIPNQPVDGEEVDEIGQMIADDFTAYMLQLFEKIGKEFIDGETV